MWWLIGSAPDFWGIGLGFKSGISNNDPDAQQDHSVIMSNISGVERGTYPGGKKDLRKKYFLKYSWQILTQ